ncbi:MAG: hypothetical protein A2506_03250 [Elusimicrobia bacterium RIFOXYD12_FULL_66_9]|nr:MAG: hypothetical protein A2506_03250 [Elusimicrobia bacterium RIFOXYD12_FULL_66_9]
MKKIAILLGLLAVPVFLTSCANLEGLKKFAASMQKGRYIIDGKLVEPPYGEPFDIRHRVTINNLPISPVIADAADAKRYGDAVKAEFDKDRLVILSSENTTIQVIEDATAFDRAKEALASGGSEEDKIVRINAALKGYVDAKLVLKNN